MICMHMCQKYCFYKRRESSRIRIEKRKDLEIWIEKNKAKYTDEIYGDLIYENYNITKQN